jgi:hypothetical protein
MPFSLLLLILLISTPCFGQTLEVQRGLKGCEKIRSEIRTIHDSIAFIEKTYRTKDPAYADFSIQQQQHLLQRLSEEWARSGCREVSSPPEKKVLSLPPPKDSMSESSDQIWEVGNRRWTAEEEYRFTRWVEENITEDFFIRYKIPTDCADAVYAIRWIYARINHLPAAATKKDGRLVGHWSTDWKHLPTHSEWYQDERFRAALLYIFPRTWTGTLPLDTYPVRISPDSVTPGTLFLVTESHTGIIGHVFLDGSHAHPLQTWESALPVRVQKLSLRYFFSEKPETKAGSGLVKFRWPVYENEEWSYLPAKEHPFYSEEQYASDFSKGYADFVEAVAKRIDPTNRPPMEKMRKVIGTATRCLKERVPVVLAGYQECQNGGCPEASELWEIHSTAGYDGMIISLMDHLSQIIESNHLDQEMAKRMMEAISIDISGNRSVTLHHVYQNYLWLSPHPEDSIEARWGLEKCGMIHTQTRTTRDCIAFIEKTYRKKDPKYADFSILQQQRLLRRLNEEWTRAECRESSLSPEKKVWVSHRPTDSTRMRRGPRKCEIIRAEIRAAHDSILFVERTYRRKDPGYADYSIQQQQHLLRGLNEEWAESKCAEPVLVMEKSRPVPPPTTDSTRVRRGSKKCERILAEIRAANDSIAFIEKTYGKKNPEYADFSIQQQQHLLRGLNEEWSASECEGPSFTPEKEVMK